MATSILINNTNCPIVTVAETIMQRSKNVHVVKIFTPEIYQQWDMKEFVAMMEFVTPDGQYRTLDLMPVQEPTKEGYLEYHVDLTAEYTKFPGEIQMTFTFIYVDTDTATTYVRKTQSCSVEVTSVEKWQDLVTDDCLSALDSRIAVLQAQVNAIVSTGDVFAGTKADNMAIVSETDATGKESSYLTLISNGKEIGDKIDIEKLGDKIVEDTPDGLIQILI